MNEINNLTYTLEINYVNKSGENTSISIKLHDNGLEIKSIKVGDICITEETINGRVLSGRFDNAEGYCGYKYDYQNGEYLININPNTPINTAISLIGNTKMAPDFMSAKLVFSSISRNDYRVVVLNQGSLHITKTVSYENEKTETFSLQESIDLLKMDGEESFAEQSNKRVYMIGDKRVVEENSILEGSDVELQLHELSNIISLHPQSYKDLIEIKHKLKLTDSSSSVYNINDEENVL